MRQSLLISLLVGGEKGGGVSFPLCHPRASVPLLMSHLGARHHRDVSDKTCQVLAREQQGHKSVPRPLWLPREHWGTARKGGTADMKGSGQCPSPLGDSPAGDSQSLVWNQCPVLSKGQDGPQPGGPEENQDPPTKCSKRQKGSVSKMTVTGIRAAGIRSRISFLELGPACMCTRVCVCVHSHTCMHVQSRKHLPKHVAMLSLDSRIKGGFPLVFYTFHSFPKVQFTLIIF